MLWSVLAWAGQEGVWETRGKAGGEQTIASVVIDPADPTRWFGLDDGHLYASYQGGHGWRAVAFDVDAVVGKGSASEAGLAFDPASPGVLYGRFNGKSRRSVDGGIRWTDDSARIEWVDGAWEVLHDVAWAPPEPARAYARDPSNRDIVYAATGKGVYASADGGKTWEARNAWLEDPDVVDIRVDPANTQRLVVLTPYNVFRSTNGGRMWAKAAADPFQRRGDRLRRIVEDDGERLVATSDARGAFGVLSGGAWSLSKERCAAVSRLGPNDLVCANAGTLARGTVQPLAFPTSLRTGFRKPEVLRLRQTPKGPVVATLDGGGALVSSDGRAWEIYTGLERGYVYDVAEDPSGSGVVFRAADGLHMYKGEAEGWVERIEDRAISTVVFDPSSPTRVYASSGGGKVHRSDDLGWTFQDVSAGLPKSPVRDLLVDSSGAGTLWAATWGDGVYRSGDSGQTWAAAGQGVGATYVRRLANDPANPDVVWAAALSAGLWRTTDGGASWTAMATGCRVVNDVAVHPLQPENVAAACEDGKVARTADGGATWPAPTKVSEYDVRSVLYTRPDGRLVAGTAAAEVVWVSDGGEVVKNDRFANMEVQRVSFLGDLQRGAVFGPEGMFLTSDGGERWEPIGLEGKDVTGVAITKEGVLAWVRGEGLVYRSDERRRWDTLRRPSVHLIGIAKDSIPCDAALPVGARVRVHSNGTEALLVEAVEGGVREWFGKPDGSWAARGALSCTSPSGTNQNELMGIPTVRYGNWSAMAGWIGLDRPGKLDRAAEKEGLRLRESVKMSDDKHLALTTDGDIVAWDGDAFLDIGAIPDDTHEYRLAIGPGGKLVLVAGTQHGVQVTTDLGKTWRPL